MKQKDLKEDKDDFDGSAPSAPVEDLEQKAAESASSEAAPRSESPSCRKDYGKQSTGAENVVVHYCDESDIPSGARKIGIREWIQYSIQHQVVKHVFKLVRLVDTQGNISNYYQPTDKNDTRRPFENVLEGYPVDFELMARILVDKYQYGLSIERVVDRLKDAGARFNTSTVLAWIKRHMKELCKLEEPFRQLLLTPGSMLFSDETTEQVRVYNQQKGKYEYRKQYIWGIKNPDRKIAYYLYDNGSRSMKVAQKFFAGFRGSVTTDGYNVYKMFEYHIYLLFFFLSFSNSPQQNLPVQFHLKLRIKNSLLYQLDLNLFLLHLKLQILHKHHQNFLLSHILPCNAKSDL